MLQDKTIGLKKKKFGSDVFEMQFFYGWVYLELHAILFRNCSVFSEGVGYLKLSFSINCIFFVGPLKCV